jgi:hypothetical protein
MIGDAEIGVANDIMIELRMDEMQGSIIKALSKFLFGAGLKACIKK